MPTGAPLTLSRERIWPLYSVSGVDAKRPYHEPDSLHQ